ncbi:MAG: hypothetical protein EA363_10120 [Balneolaceae bacterium]|nr:MAG: hypothetical protein EA363_10120 [Balneolaceae bacterium]
MTICFFEDEGDRLFAPLTLTRPVDDLRIGILTIREKWQRYLGIQDPDKITRVGRAPITLLYHCEAPGDGEEVLWINARWLPDAGAAELLSGLESDVLVRRNGTIVAARLGPEESRKYRESGTRTFSQAADTEALPVTDTSCGEMLDFLWDLFMKNEMEIRKDVALLGSADGSMDGSAGGSAGGPATNGNNLPDFPGAVLNSREHIHAEENVRVDPGVIIDASSGPVYLGAGCHVMSGAIIQGPVAIGGQSVVRMGTRIYAGTTIGPVCKVSGEIQNVILYGHSNKAHDGYLGNSLIGEWCNLGANTTTSNLKNNYKPIRIPEWSTGHVHKTSIQFFGTVMGDHGKTAINTTLSAGTLCGVFCNIFTYGFPPKHVPSFSWVSPHHTEPYQFEKAMETAEIMMERRGVPLSRSYLLMMKHIFDRRNGV